MSAEINETMTNWRDLPDIDDAEELTEDDRRCLTEVMEVIRRNGRMNKFGVMLLHSHFPLKEDEFMLETCHRANRTLTLLPVREEELQPGTYRPTSWRWDQGSIRPVGACASGMYGSHYGYKDD